MKQTNTQILLLIDLNETLQFVVLSKNVAGCKLREDDSDLRIEVGTIFFISLT